MERPQAHGTKEIKFPHESSLWRLTNTSQHLHAWGLTTSDRCIACGKTASLKHILTGCDYALRSYTWRHNEVLEIFSEVSKTCCETVNKAPNIINNRAIQFVKEGNISKTARRNMRKSSLFEGCTDWHVATDLKHNFIFPTEIALTTKHLDIVIWSVKAKKVFVIELTAPFEENFDWAHQRKLEKYEDLREQCVRNGWITNVFPIEVRCRGFIANSTSVFLTNFRLPPSDKTKYIEKIQDKALTASAWIWQSYRATKIDLVSYPARAEGLVNMIARQKSDKVWWCREILLGRSGLVVMVLRPRNHAQTQSSSDEAFVRNISYCMIPIYKEMEN